MSILRLFSAIFGMAVLAMMGIAARGEMNDQAARERARQAVRTHLHLEGDKFLQVQRDEMLEQVLALVVARSSWSEFIYKVSEEGDEIKEHAVVHHIVMDGDPTFRVAINPVSGSLYRIQGFPDSLAEFNRLMTEAKVKLLTPDQAEAVAKFCREANPQRRSLAPLSSLLDLKQAAERQCQGVPFDPDEKAFDAWWKHAKALYAGVTFQQTTARSGSGYVAEWIVLSSDAAGNCGGAPLRAELEVGMDGQVGKLTFVPLPHNHR